MSKVITILKSREEHLTKFREIFAKSPLRARVFSMSNQVLLVEERLIEDANNLSILYTNKQYGVSKTDKIYCRSTITKAITVKDNKFWLKSYRACTSLKLSDLVKEEREILSKKYSWINFLHENNVNIAFNTVVKHKLYDLRKVLTYLYKVPWPTCKLIHHQFNNNIYDYKRFKQAIANISNLENFNIVLLENNVSYFFDCTLMAKKLNRTINAGWSLRRLQEEHDNMAVEITNILLEDTNEPLKIAQPFIDFNKYIGGLITDTKGLALEGTKQKHCVAGYAGYVNNGRCAIYHVEGYTLELNMNNAGDIYPVQFKGYANCAAPKELSDKVIKLLNEFQPNNNISAHKTPTLLQRIDF